MANLMLTNTAAECDGELVGDELWRWRNSVVSEEEVAVVLEANEGAHRVAHEAAVPNRWSRSMRRPCGRRDRRGSSLRWPTVISKIRALARDWREESWGFGMRRGTGRKGT